MNLSLGGYIAASSDDIGWSVPSEELFQWWSNRAVTEIARLKAEDGGTVDVGRATLAAAVMRAGLIDEYVLVTHPVLVGGGKPFFTPLDNWVNLRLAETRTFPYGVILTRYETRR